MVDTIIASIKEEILGAKPRQELVDRIVQAPAPDELYPAQKAEEDPLVRIRGLVTYLIQLMYHGMFEKIEGITRDNQMHKTETVQIAQLSFDFAYQMNQFQVCFDMLGFFELDAGRTGKIVLRYIREFLEKREFKKASEVWNSFQKRGVQKKMVMEEVEKTFKQIANFPATNVHRNYAPVFELVELFEIPKSMTYWSGIEQYNYAMGNRDYYMAALVAKRLQLPASHVSKAGFTAFRNAFYRISENLARGAYKEISHIAAGDPYMIAKDIRDEFNLFDFKAGDDKKDTSVIKKISELAYDLFLNLLDTGVASGNTPVVMHLLGVQIITDYQLMNSKINLTVSQNMQDAIDRFIDSIASAILEKVNVEVYYKILRELRLVYQGDFERLVPLAVNLTSRALAEKEIELANKFYADFRFPLTDICETVISRILEWMNKGDFDSILLVLKYFPFHSELRKNETFMTGLKRYYQETIKSKKVLKSIAIAEAFRLERPYFLEPVKIHIQDVLTEGNLDQAKKLIQKYHVRRNEYLPVLKRSYVSILRRNKLLAGRLRNELQLSIFDVGVKNWLFYEVLGLTLTGEGQKTTQAGSKKQ